MLTALYGLQVTLFLTHEIDSGRWAEWQLFGIGGPAFFVLVHIPVIAVLMYGMAALVQGRDSGYWIALVSAAFGVFALGIHGYFLLTGNPEFSTPESLALIGGMFVVALPLAAYSVKALRADDEARAG